MNEYDLKNIFFFLQIYEQDSCHKLAWCLDACIRDKKIEPRRIKELQSYFDAIPSGDSVLGDIAMILADPYAMNTIIYNIHTSLMEVIEREVIPKVRNVFKQRSFFLFVSFRLSNISHEICVFLVPIGR
jgi:negative elongation factor B